MCDDVDIEAIIRQYNLLKSNGGLYHNDKVFALCDAYQQVQALRADEQRAKLALAAHLEALCLDWENHLKWDRRNSYNQAKADCARLVRAALAPTETPDED